ncbi:histidine phosphatase family protein [Amycolatopsis sp. FBCC-B4732]|uniref:histidine phosphatase family protein n=1 Tax=Amycolatopsis sp. FBCC-B4732 TaxID=3079339 RepID=UPI001FF6AC63|nr:histidine phosphatase family protein [Amycolatopsis sp. FBCC-B4732]UOX87628.1 histidine phosphatase family protein [Amycolatopsis sp. FBCC-B4732]
MKVFLVRHAQTQSNREGRFSGRTDEPIAAGQAASAEAAAKFLASRGVVQVFCSPLRRARDTAEPLIRITGRRLQVVEGFNEIRMSPLWDGRLKAEVEEVTPDAYKLWRSAPHLVELSGQETLHEVQARAVEAVEALAEDPSGPTCAVYTHDAVIRLLLLRALGLGAERYRSLKIVNCGISSLEVEGGRWAISMVNAEAGG